MSNWILVGPVVGVILITVTLVLAYVVIPPIIVQQVIENVRLEQGTEQYERWVELPQPLDFKVWIFNVTNVAEVQAGLMPKVEEIGPYVYTQTRRKYNINFSRDKERATFYSQQTYHFNPAASNGHENDTIVVLNMPMNSILLTVEKDFPMFLEVLDPQLEAMFGPGTNSFFSTTRVKDLLFDGIKFCEDPGVTLAGLICDTVYQQNSPSIIRTEDGKSLIFSLFGHKNRTHDGLFEVNTGMRRIDRVQRIERWRNARNLPYWKAGPGGVPSACQMINGTDGTQASPFREENDDLYTFSSDICRSVHLQWQGRTSFNGINAYRYGVADSFLNEIDPCFCTHENSTWWMQPNGCLPRGAMDLTECLAAPVVISMPHFYNADPRFEALIDGLEADPDKHSIFLDMEPYTGAPVRAAQVIQFNQFLRRIEGITISNNFHVSRLFP